MKGRHLILCHCFQISLGVLHSFSAAPKIIASPSYTWAPVSTSSPPSFNSSKGVTGAESEDDDARSIQTLFPHELEGRGQRGPRRGSSISRSQAVMDKLPQSDSQVIRYSPQLIYSNIIETSTVTHPEAGFTPRSDMERIVVHLNATIIVDRHRNHPEYRKNHYGSADIYGTASVRIPPNRGEPAAPRINLGITLEVRMTFK